MSSYSAITLTRSKNLAFIASCQGQTDAMKGSYLGPEYKDYEIEAELETCGAIYKKLSENE